MERVSNYLFKLNKKSKSSPTVGFSIVKIDLQYLTIKGVLHLLPQN